MLTKNTFSRNTFGDTKQLTIRFNGTKEEWLAILNNPETASDWHNGLKDGSQIICNDGNVATLDRGWTGLGNYNWKWN